MANIPIYNGEQTWASGITPFGFYDSDSEFQADALKVTKFCAIRLGFPIENVELQSGSFFTAFEEAVTVYGNELYAYKQREDYLSIEGAGKSYGGTDTDLSSSLITPNMGNVIRLSEQYGEEAGVGGNTNWYSGSVVLTAGVQDYDLNEWAINSGSLSGSELEVKRVYFNGIPASANYYYGAPGFGLGVGFGGFLGAYGFTAYNTAYSTLVMPVAYDIAAIQELEMSNTVRMSSYSFELINNRLRIFPIPGSEDNGANLWFQYLNKTERLNNSFTTGSNIITNISQVPYRNISYSQVNSVGRMWIFEYTLALSKEMLGLVRNKYSTIPIPGAEVTLNGGELTSQAAAEKNALVERLRIYFDETSRRSLLERKSNESTFAQEELNKVPMTIFVG